MVDLDGTVDEVKENIRNASNVDYKELLKQEEEGKNRKTIIEFIEKKIGEEVDEQMHNEEETQEEVEEELVEEIEEETSGGFLGSFTKTQVASGGLLLGILAGLVAGALMAPMDNSQDIGPQAAQQTVQDLITGSGSNATVGQATKESGLYKVPLSQQVTQGNQTTTQEQNYYITTDGKLLIPETVRSALGQPRRVVLQVSDIRESIQQQQAQQETGPEVEETTNETSQ